MIELFLNSNFSDQSFLNLTAGKRCFLNLFHSYLYSCWFMFCKLNFTIWTFSQRSFLCLNKLKVSFSNIRQHYLKFLLLSSQYSSIIWFLNKRCWSLNSLHITKKNGISSFWHLSRAFELMDFEPVLLKASLTTILYRFTMTLRTCIKRNELLIDVTLRVITSFDDIF